MQKLTVAIALMLLLSMLLTMVACDNGTTETSKEQTASTDASTDTSTSDDESRYVANVPTTGFEGETLIFMIRDQEHGVFQTWDFQSEEFNEEVINDALDARNGYIEDTFDVTLEALQVGGERNYGTMYDKIDLAANAGTEDFDVAYAALYDMVKLAGNQALYDVNEIKHIDTTQPWWSQTALKEITIANRCFGLIGSISVQINETVQGVLFNKQMFKDNEFGDPYQLVKEDKWFMDTMFSFAKDIYADTGDLNGQIDIKDTFGIGGQNDTIYNYFYGSNGRTALLDNDGIPTITLDSEANVTKLSYLIEKIRDKEVFMNANDYFNVPGYTSSPSEYIVNAFAEGRMLFYCEGLLHVNTFRNYDIDFGVLPVPKYDANQEDYSHLIGAWGATCVVFPIHLDDERLELAGAIVEAMSAESMNTLVPAYYEKLLKKRDTRDEEGEAMLDIIFNTISIDAGLTFNWGSIKTVFTSMISQGPDSFASNYDKVESSVKAEMDTTVETFQNIPHNY